MSIFFTSDTHFNHISVIKYNNRPYSCIQEMNESLIDNWNNIVNKHDIVYHLGDFAWSNHNYFISRLNGKKILIKGNHDKFSQDVAKNFTQIENQLTIKIQDKIIILSHTAQRVWDRSHYGSYHLFGHSHGRLKTYNLSLDVGVDANNYRPISYDQVIDKMNLRYERMVANNRVHLDRNPIMYHQDDVEYFEKLCILDQTNTRSINECN